jgi:uncharacterized protein involved in outer membrane biogenesis
MTDATQSSQPSHPVEPSGPRKSSIGKVIKWIVLIVIAAIVIGVLVLYLNLNRIVRTTVESQASTQLKLPTQLGSANVSLFSGDVNLGNFKIGSPQGFSAPEMFTLGAVDVGVNYSQLRDDPIHVGNIRISNPKLVIEHAGGKFNIKAVMDQLSPGAPETADQKEPIKLIIDNLTIANASVAIRPGLDIKGLDLKGLNLKDEYAVTIPTVELKNIGTGEGNKNGAAIKDVVMLAMTSLASKAADSESLPPELRAILTGDLTQITARLKEQLNIQVQKVTEDLTKRLPGELGSVVGDVIKDPKAATTNPGALIEQGVGSLLNRQKKPAAPTTKPAR